MAVVDKDQVRTTSCVAVVVVVVVGLVVVAVVLLLLGLLVPGLLLLRQLDLVLDDVHVDDGGFDVLVVVEVDLHDHLVVRVGHKVDGVVGVAGGPAGGPAGGGVVGGHRQGGRINNLVLVVEPDSDRNP